MLGSGKVVGKIVDKLVDIANCSEVFVCVDKCDNV